MKKLLLIILVVGTLASCQNGEWDFPDYDYTAVYFAYQTPVRTIILGEDYYPNELDNAHKCQIMATMGGVYENKNDVEIGIKVDNSLCDNLTFGGGGDVIPMPDNYYTLSSDKIIIKKGEALGGVEVQLSDAFFTDPLALQNTYVIPVVMTGVVNADSILAGVPKEAGARRAVADDWDVAPKDYILYAVKYVNPYHGNYLIRGKDEVTKDGVSSTVVRHKAYVEKDEVRKLTATALKEIEFPMDYKNKEDQDMNFKVKVSLDEQEQCTISPIAASYQMSDTVRVYNIEASGNGKFVKKGEKKSWGNKDRDAFYLQYSVSYEVEIKYPELGLPTDIQKVEYHTTDTLVVRDRAVKMPEVFDPVLK